MIWRLILSSRPARWLAGALVAMAGLLGALALIRRDAAKDAKNEVQHEYESETSRRVEAGREALRDDPGGAPDERVPRSDAKWK